MAQDRIEGRRIRVRGVVQGVGFRPHVWQLANDARLAGQVRNDGGGVEIEVWGTPRALATFKERLGAAPPPLARIDTVSDRALSGRPPAGPFRIVASKHGAISTGIVPDAATCSRCVSEMLDPADRRYRYPFINCTHCGPRLSIVREIPYDRATTSMAVFGMCSGCRAEYDNPADRRFHAQPNACPDCGPQVWLEDAGGEVACPDPIGRTAELIADGAIVAVKGIGGFHLACDARREAPVAELRRRKRREHKPLAVMARDLQMVGEFATVTGREAELLASTAAPIVLLEMAGQALAPAIAPGQDRIGAMLPYSGLHHLLLAELDGPVVLTSGNVSDEPQVTANDEALTRLEGIADFWLMHDREIVNRLDDSLLRIDAGNPAVLRRARGMAPEPLPMPGDLAGAPATLAMGGELKSTFCLSKGGQAILSQHMGDLEEVSVIEDYRKNLDLYRRLHDFDAEVVAVDLHPDYISTQIGETIARETGIPLVRVQHHHAHLAACLADRGVPPDHDRSLGIVLDGLGLGPDGTIWGGEFLLGGYSGFTRAGHFPCVPLPGGIQAMREPWRNTYAHLRVALGEGFLDDIADTEIGRFLSSRPAAIGQMVDKGINAPLSSSAGRLFDAVSATLGLCPERQDYEGHAAMLLEARARPFIGEETCYAVGETGGTPRVLDWAPLWEAICDDLRKGTEPGRIAARFHLGLAAAVASTAGELALENGVKRIVLVGGVMQNQILVERLEAILQERGHDVLTHRRVPANDGGLALGQAAIAGMSSAENGADVNP